MPRHVQHIVDATQQPEETLVVALGAIAGEVAAWEAAPVLLLVAFGIAPDGARHGGPGSLQHEIATASERYGPSLLVEHVSLDRGERECRRARLQRGDARQGCDEDLTRLGHPPRIDHWRAIEP